MNDPSKKIIWIIAVITIITLGAGGKIWYDSRKADSLTVLNNSLMAQIMKEMAQNTFVEIKHKKDVKTLIFNDPNKAKYENLVSEQNNSKEYYNVTLIDKKPFGNGPTLGDSLDGISYSARTKRFGYNVEKDNSFPYFPIIKFKYWGHDIERVGTKIRASNMEKAYENLLAYDFLTMLKAVNNGRKK